jgi:hypothetical protein
MDQPLLVDTDRFMHLSLIQARLPISTDLVHGAFDLDAAAPVEVLGDHSTGQELGDQLSALELPIDLRTLSIDLI